MTLQDQAKIIDLVKVVAVTACVFIFWAATLQNGVSDNASEIEDIDFDVKSLKNDAKEIRNEMRVNHKETIELLHAIKLEMKDKLDRN